MLVVWKSRFNAMKTMLCTGIRFLLQCLLVIVVKIIQTIFKCCKWVYDFYINFATPWQQKRHRQNILILQQEWKTHLGIPEVEFHVPDDTDGKRFMYLTVPLGIRNENIQTPKDVHTFIANMKKLDKAKQGQPDLVGCLKKMGSEYANVVGISKAQFLNKVFLDDEKWLQMPKAHIRTIYLLQYSDVDECRVCGEVRSCYPVNQTRYQHVCPQCVDGLMNCMDHFSKYIHSELTSNVGNPERCRHIVDQYKFMEDEDDIDQRCFHYLEEIIFE